MHTDTFSTSKDMFGARHFMAQSLKRFLQMSHSGFSASSIDGSVLLPMMMIGVAVAEGSWCCDAVRVAKPAKARLSIRIVDVDGLKCTKGNKIRKLDRICSGLADSFVS